MPTRPIRSGALDNTEIHLDEIGSFQLVDGRYQDAGGPAMRLTATVVTTARGDLDGDGVSDGAVVLKTRIGDHPPVFHLAAVLIKDGKGHNVGSLRLGAKAHVSRLVIDHHGTIECTVNGREEDYILDHDRLTRILTVKRR